MAREYKEHEDTTFVVRTEAIFLDFGIDGRATVTVTVLPDGTVCLVPLDDVKFSTPTSMDTTG